MNLSTEAQNYSQASTATFVDNKADVVQREVVIADSTSLVYAIGHIKPFFPTLDLEKQYEAAVSMIQQGSSNYAGADTSEVSKFTVFDYTVTPDNQPNLAYRPFLYLAEEATWILTINQVDTYILTPRTMTQRNALIDATKDAQAPFIVMGHLGELTLGNASGSASLPVVMLEHLEGITPAAPGSLSGNAARLNELPIPGLKPNIGRTSLERASNYFQSHYNQINQDIDGSPIVENISALHADTLNAMNNPDLIEIIITSSNRSRFACSIDVNNTYPFVSSKLSPYAKSHCS
ncbi:hypothetical protein EYS14_19525 [Alteromonadaceae bacterium M269]|nr:hypothetical protein EYS14_19525 [Alteromonadaceae bacterium M269]